MNEFQLPHTPKTCVEAVEILRHELITDKELYNGFLASIESALDESPDMEGVDTDALAKKVLDRIIGEENHD